MSTKKPSTTAFQFLVRGRKVNRIYQATLRKSVAQEAWNFYCQKSFAWVSLNKTFYKMQQMLKVRSSILLTLNVTEPHSAKIKIIQWTCTTWDLWNLMQVEALLTRSLSSPVYTFPFLRESGKVSSLWLCGILFEGLSCFLSERHYAYSKLSALRHCGTPLTASWLWDHSSLTQVQQREDFCHPHA